MARHTDRKVRVLNLGRLQENLLDRIHGMLQAGKLAGAPPDYWKARKQLERKRKLARRVQ